jgi:hypothetical protein
MLTREIFAHCRTERKHVGQASASLLLISARTAKVKSRQAEQAAEKVFYFVIPNEVRNLSLVYVPEKRDSSARGAPRNDKM